MINIRSSKLKLKKYTVVVIVSLFLVIFSTTYVAVKQASNACSNFTVPGFGSVSALDYPTYESISDLKAEATVIVLGKVVGSSKLAPATTAVDGTSIPGIPYTNYAVHVDKGFKCKSISKNITISIIDDSGAYELPVLENGQTYLFFLKESKGKYYPLAGGNAIGTPTSKGVYSIDSTIDGGQPFIVKEQDL